MRSASGWPLLARSSRMRPNACLRGLLRAVGAGGTPRGGTGIGSAWKRSRCAGCANGRGVDMKALQPRRPRRRQPGQRLPFLRPRPPPMAARSASTWVGVIRPAWLSLCPCERQAEALDRVGDEQGRRVVLGARRTPRSGSRCSGRQPDHQLAAGRRRMKLSRRARAGACGRCRPAAARARPRRPGRSGPRTRRSGRPRSSRAAPRRRAGRRRASGPCPTSASRPASRRFRRCRRSGRTSGRRWSRRGSGGCSRRSTRSCGCRACRPRSGTRRCCPRPARRRPGGDEPRPRPPRASQPRPTR